MLKTWYEYCDADAYNCFDRINELDVSFLLEKCIYHAECYKNITHSKNLERLVKRQKINPDTLGNESNGSIEQRIDTETPVQDEAPRLLRSNSQPYFKELCIICQQQGGKLHKVETIHIGQRMLKVAKELPDQLFYLRMNSIPNSADAVANDVQYHLKCWILAERSIQVYPGKVQIFDDTKRVVADIEIIEIVRTNCNESKIIYYYFLLFIICYYFTISKKYNTNVII